MTEQKLRRLKDLEEKKIELQEAYRKINLAIRDMQRKDNRTKIKYYYNLESNGYAREVEVDHTDMLEVFFKERDRLKNKMRSIDLEFKLA